MLNQSRLLSREPAWIENRAGIRHTLPIDVASWTFEPGSLTRRLRSYYGQAVKVSIVYHKWLKPLLSERRLLEIPEYRYCLIREVLLNANGLPLILARTVMPEQTIAAAHRNLSHLGTRPLGEVIFSYPDLERVELQITKLQPMDWCPRILPLAAIAAPVWGRRTVYAIKGQPLLVNEFFLPGALAV